LYPRMHLLPDGHVFVSGPAPVTMIFNPATKAWSPVATTNYSGTRTYGSSVLLPLTPADGYKPRVMIFGGGDPATATTEIIDLSAATPQWQYGPPMSQPRIEMNATILPNGKVLALGGSAHDEDATTASLNADLYDPDTNTFSSAGANAFPRLYHSNALLLPDGTVWVVGGNPQRGTYEQHMEIYSPAYVFNADGSLAARPTIGGGPGAIGSAGREHELYRHGCPGHGIHGNRQLRRQRAPVGGRRHLRSHLRERCRLDHHERHHQRRHAPGGLSAHDHRQQRRTRPQHHRHPDR